MLNAYRAKLIRDGVISPKSYDELCDAHNKEDKRVTHPNQQSKTLSRVNAIIARRASFKTQ